MLLAVLGIVPALHFLLAVGLPGYVLAARLGPRLRLEALTPTARLLLACVLGLHLNTLAFGVALGLRAAGVRSVGLLALTMYALDIAALVSAGRRAPATWAALSADCRAALGPRPLACLQLFALLIGATAILCYPHVHDSGQLIWTNHILEGGCADLSRPKLAWGFSGLVFPPAALLRSVPLGTLAAGFKLPWWLLLALAARHAVEQLRVRLPRAAAWLLFLMTAVSYFGLAAGMILGKDSSWGVLLSLIAIVSLLGDGGRERYGLGVLAGLAAFSMGIIAGAFLLQFLALWLSWEALGRLRPWREAGDERAAYWIALAGCLALMAVWMPVSLPIYSPPLRVGDASGLSYYYPAAGDVAFLPYFFRYGTERVSNSTLVIALGTIAALLLPLSRERFANRRLRSLALLPFASGAFAVTLAAQARGFVPGAQALRIPGTPFSTFDAWNLLKDLPQWYLQAVMALLALWLIDSAVERCSAIGWAPAGWFGLIACVVALAGLGPPLVRAGWKFLRPAHFEAYGGHRDRAKAAVFNAVWAHRGLRDYWLVDTTAKAARSRWLYFDTRHYDSRVSFRITTEASGVAAVASQLPTPSLVVVRALDPEPLLTMIRTGAGADLHEISSLRGQRIFVLRRVSDAPLDETPH